MPQSSALTRPATTWPDVHVAAARLAGRVMRTPLVHATDLDVTAGARLWFKAENLQRGGSYKVRGATLAVQRAVEVDRCAGVIAQSTGNHAVAVATAARRWDLPATVVLPVDASLIKVRAAAAAGARVVFAGTTVDQRLAAVQRLRAATGYAVVDAYDDPDVVGGQGSAAVEMLDQVRDAGGALDALVVPVGGGSGVAGACLAAVGTSVAVYGVEPDGCGSLSRSLAAGRPVTAGPGRTIADGLRPSRVGALPFAITRDLVSGVLSVDDAAITDALRLLLRHVRLLVEPSAAAALAGALVLARSGRFRDIGVLLTGGNVDVGLLTDLLARRDPAAAAGRTANLRAAAAS